jgi:hypothetical protein
LETDSAVIVAGCTHRDIVDAVAVDVSKSRNRAAEEIPELGLPGKTCHALPDPPLRYDTASGIEE